MTPRIVLFVGYQPSAFGDGIRCMHVEPLASGAVVRHNTLATGSAASKYYRDRISGRENASERDF